MISSVSRFFERFGIHLRRRRHLWAGVDLFLDLDRLRGLSTFVNVFDVGANIGDFSARFRRYFPEAVIHAFEPVSSNFSILREETEGIPGLEIHQLAVSNSCGRREIFLHDGPALHSLERPSAGGRSEWVDTVTLDEFCRESGIKIVDFLKIDTEGHELSVLKGAEGLLRSGAIRCLLVESTMIEEDPRYVTLGEFRRVLEPFGFVLHSLHEQAIREDGRLVFFNALFVLPLRTAKES